MSYNIDGIDMLSSTLRMKIGDVRRLAIQLEDELPEDNFLFDLEKEIKKRIKAGRDADEVADNVELPIKRFAWRGEGSGYSFDTLLTKIVPHLIGGAEMILIWEGGDSIIGLRIKDGVATKHQVIQMLGDPL